MADPNLAQYIHDALASGSEGVFAASRTMDTTVEVAEVEVTVGVTETERNGIWQLFARRTFKATEAHIRVLAVMKPDPRAEPAPVPPVPEPEEEPKPEVEALRAAEIRQLQDILVEHRVAGACPQIRGRWNSEWQRIAVRVFGAEGWDKLPSYPVRGMLDSAKRWR